MCQIYILLYLYFSQVIDAMRQVDVNFAKTFDRVSHKLLFKVQKVLNNTQITRRLEAYLKDRTQHVEIDGSQSHRASIESGVLQGLDQCYFSYTSTI